MKSNKPRLKVLLCVWTCLFVAVVLCGCFDLGDFPGSGPSTASDGSDYSSYYNTFGKVVGIYRSEVDDFGNVYGSTKEYDIERSLFNATTLQKGLWDNKDDEVEVQEYVYVAIPVEKSFTMGNFALYLKADKVEYPDRQFNIKVYLVDKIPAVDKVCYYGCPLQLEYRDEEHPDGYIVTVEYEDPKDEQLIGESSIRPRTDMWDSFMISQWKVGDDYSETIPVKAGQVILLKFEQNTGYVLLEDENRCTFSFTNMFVYSLKEE